MKVKKEGLTFCLFLIVHFGDGLKRIPINKSERIIATNVIEKLYDQQPDVLKVFVKREIEYELEDILKRSKSKTQTREMTVSEYPPTLGFEEYVKIAQEKIKCLTIGQQGERSICDDTNCQIKDELAYSGLKPRIFCEGFSFKDSENKLEMDHFLYLTIDNVELKEKHIIFIIEMKDHDSGEWRIIRMTEKLLNQIPVEYLLKEYQFRVTAIGLNGTSRGTTNKYKTLNGLQSHEYKYIPPKRIYVEDYSPNMNETGVDVKIAWEWAPNETRPCFYKIKLEKIDHTEPVSSFRVKEPNEVFGINGIIFPNLKFGEQYSIQFIPYNGSTHAINLFTTPTCLAAFNYSFVKCIPPSPRDVNTRFKHLNFKDNIFEEKSLLISIRVAWSQPPYTSPSNPILEYILEFIEKNSIQNPRNRESLRIPGNETSVTLPPLKLYKDFTGLLYAVSQKGPSKPLIFSFSTKNYKPEIGSPVSSSWIYGISILVCIVLLYIVYKCSKLYIKRRQIKLARKQYFEGIEESNEANCDWSTSPLTSGYELKLKQQIFNENFPKEKWEIAYEDLKVGDILGTGAFGIVRKGVMQKERFSKLPHKIQDAIQMANDGVIKDEISLAVKMLKVSATREDRDQLLKEILTMHNIGYHPQIVCLIGACLRGRKLCLVLEYCPGGNLLNFLRKVREKYWPNLGLDDSNLNGINNLELCYADMCSNSLEREHSDISAQASSPSSKNMDFPSIIEEEKEVEGDGCRPLEPKEILGFARQVALGCEFLERNHVVHRDLACRNVLLLGDYKRVKLSDFGLSRDIYSRNMYHQKSEGKLPVKWLAVESIFTHIFTSKSDVWSFGIFLWDFRKFVLSPTFSIHLSGLSTKCTGIPYPGLSNSELFDALKRGYRMERPDNCSEELHALMKKCWRNSPNSRPNFEEIRLHLDAMIESVEPEMYLNLMSKIPGDYLSSRCEAIIPDNSSSSSNSSIKGTLEASISTSFHQNRQRGFNQNQKPRNDPLFDLKPFICPKTKIPRHLSDLNQISEGSYESFASDHKMGHVI